ncbi:MAG: hypothetical protein RSF69_03870 [Erysipelotrichaceae bacterium]
MKKKIFGYSIYFTIVILIQVIASLMKYNLATFWEIVIVFLGLFVIASSGTLRISSNQTEKENQNKKKDSSLVDVLFAFSLMIPVFINIFFF